MTYTTEITPSALLAIRQHGEKDFPNECCGFLFGKEGDVRKISLVRPAQNIKAGDKRRRFVVDPHEYMEAERFALLEGLDFLGIYHSHPNHPAVASEHDRKQAVPFFSYVIVSVMDGKSEQVLSWRRSEDGSIMEEETLSLADNSINSLQSI